MREITTTFEEASIESLGSPTYGSLPLTLNFSELALTVFDSHLHDGSPPLNTSDSLTGVWDSIISARYDYQGEFFSRSYHGLGETFFEVTSMYTDTASSRYFFESFIPGTIERPRTPEPTYGHEKYFKKKKVSKKHLLLHRRWLQKMKRILGFRR